MSLREPPFTVGIEEEYLLVDRRTGELANDPPPRLLEECGERSGGQISPEFLRCQVEVGTRVARSMLEARADLARLRKLIVEEKDDKLYDAIRIGKEEGMQVFNDSLYHFVTKEYVARADAFEISPNVEQLKMMLKGIDVKGPAIL